MHALVGLSSQAAQVENVSKDSITLRVSDLRVLGGAKATVVELLNNSRTFQRLVKIKVVQTAARPKGGYSIVGRLLTPLSDEDLKALRSL